MAERGDQPATKVYCARQQQCNCFHRSYEYYSYEIRTAVALNFGGYFHVNRLTLQINVELNVRVLKSYDSSARNSAKYAIITLGAFFDFL